MPIGVGPTSGTNLAPGQQSYEEHILIRESDIDNQGEILKTYSGYLVDKVTIKTQERLKQELFANTADSVARQLIRRELATYLFSSFLRKEPINSRDWLAAFWDIRGQCGAEYADRLLIYMVKTMADTPLRPETKPFFQQIGDSVTLPNSRTNWRIRIYLEQANKVVDNNDANWPTIEGILVKRNLMGEP